MGHVSDCLIYCDDFHSFGPDINLNLMPNPRWPRRWLEKTCAPRYEVFHFHSTTFLDMMLDVPLLKTLGKTVILHFHGYELRTLFAPAGLSRQWFGDYASGGRDRTYAHIAVFLASRFADTILVSTPDMAPWIHGAILVPQPLEIEYWKVDASLSTNRNGGVINIVHTPSNRLIQGGWFTIV